MQIEIPLSHQQRAFASDRHPIKILIAGRRWGKSLLMKAMLTQKCLEMKGRSLLIMPIQSQANDWYTELITDSEVETFEEYEAREDEYGDTREYTYESVFLEKKPKLWPYPLMTFKGTRHRLGFRSFENPKRIRGGNCTGLIVCDEANDLDGQEVTRVLISKILDTRAQIILTSTITHHNYLWDLYLQGQGNDPLVKSWLFTTPEGVAFQGEEGKARLAAFRSLYAENDWNAECLCIPNKDGTGVFPYIDNCLTTLIPPEKPEDGRLYIMGLDLGRVGDPEELIVLDDQGQVVFHESFELGLSHEVMAQRVATRARYWKASVVIDATGAGGSGGARSGDDSHVLTYRAALPEGVLFPMYWSANAESRAKKDIISHLALGTEQGKVQIHRDKFPRLISQMRRYKFITTKDGRTIGMGCQGVGDARHDDCVAALAQAYWGIKMHWFRQHAGLPLTLA